MVSGTCCLCSAPARSSSACWARLPSRAAPATAPPPHRPLSLGLHHVPVHLHQVYLHRDRLLRHRPRHHGHQRDRQRLSWHAVLSLAYSTAITVTTCGIGDRCDSASSSTRTTRGCSRRSSSALGSALCWARLLPRQDPATSTPSTSSLLLDFCYRCLITLPVSHAPACS